MVKRLSTWIVGGLSVGAVISVVGWYFLSYQLQLNLVNSRQINDQSAITSIVETSIHNPEVQTILRSQILRYLKSPEGKASLAEMMRSPEMKKTLAENIQSPEMRPAILNMLQEPEFKDSLLKIIQDTPEMRVLKLLNASVEWNEDYMEKR
ncbi:hypothetical protein [Acetonema longum]|uniref:hypothetical protein n=1 Tax=Acetonema longum TaxID=2374 RepID=UPI0003066EEA|nr:hypothetical protein [Acetonema longum]